MQILKLGGSAITKKAGYMQADAAGIARLAGAVAKARNAGARDLVVVHGAGSFGHAPVIRYNLNHGVRTERQRRGVAITHASCARLSSLVVDALAKKGVPAISIPPASLIFSSNRRIQKLDASPIMSLLKAGMVPVLYGDMVPDAKPGWSVCSGDQIVAYLGRKAKRMVLATNVDGVLADGKLVPEINRRNFGAIRKHLGSSGSPDVTGGMAGKIAELLKAKKPAYVVNAKKPERIVALLLGKKAVCTKIRF